MVYFSVLPQLNYSAANEQTMIMQSEAPSMAACYHCGSAVTESAQAYDGKLFCCPGCRSVYQILNESQLCL
jgi:Cu+-exporting ATPase